MAEKKNILRLRLPKWIGKKSRFQGRLTALDLDGQTLRVVQASPRGGKVVISAVLEQKLEFAENADRTDPAVFGKAMAKALDELDTKTGAVVMGVPRAQVVLRTLSLPILRDVRELASMVHLQVSKDLPFRMDEAVIDFKVQRQIQPAPNAPDATREGEEPGEAPAKLEVLVACIKRDLASFYQQAAAAAGLKLAALGLIADANARCIQACEVAEPEETVALLSLRPDEVNFDVIEGTALLFSRGAKVKLNEPTSAVMEEEGGDAPEGVVSLPTLPQPATYADAVAIEVIRSLHSYSSAQPSSPIRKVVVAGATGEESAVVRTLTDRVSVPAAVLDPGKSLDLPPNTEERARGAAGAIGLAFSAFDPAGLAFDFLAPKKPAVQRDMRRIRILSGIAAAAALVIFVAGFRSYLINQRTKVKRQVEMELAGAKEKRPIYRRMIQQADTVEDWNTGGRNWLEHYAYLSAILPGSEEVYISSLTVSGQGTIRLSVQARSGEVLARLDKQLRAVGYDVKPLAITPGADRYGYEFRSSVELLVPDKMKIDLSKVRAPARLSDDASLDPAVFRKGGAG